jgi:hypothetical protein
METWETRQVKHAGKKQDDRQTEGFHRQPLPLAATWTAPITAPLTSQHV